MAQPSSLRGAQSSCLPSLRVGKQWCMTYHFIFDTLIQFNTLLAIGSASQGRVHLLASGGVLQSSSSQSEWENSILKLWIFISYPVFHSTNRYLNPPTPSIHTWCGTKLNPSLSFFYLNSISCLIIYLSRCTILIGVGMLSFEGRKMVNYVDGNLTMKRSAVKVIEVKYARSNGCARSEQV